MFPFAYQYPSKERHGLCICQCHAGTPILDWPQAVEAKVCQECAEERFASWNALVDVLMRDD